MKNTNGFTLIELLVVVLIIGILAAVALPQYQKAVEKTRTTQLFVRADALDKAAQAYSMANGKYPTDIRDLDLDISESGSSFQKTEISSTAHTGIVFADGSECATLQHPLGDGLWCRNENIGLLFGANGNRKCKGRTTLGEAVCRSMATGDPDSDGRYPL